MQIEIQETNYNAWNSKALKPLYADVMLNNRDKKKKIAIKVYARTDICLFYSVLSHVNTCTSTTISENIKKSYTNAKNFNIHPHITMDSFSKLCTYTTVQIIGLDSK